MKKNYENYNSRIVLFCIALILLVTPVMAATTQLHIVKYANDGTTILNETTKTYQWLEANLPVLGDGTTHYYSQGPTFNDTNLWDDAESLNIDTRDWGAVKGTDLKDICNLVGGMSAGETVKIKASDGFSKTFPYAYIYTPNSRQGAMGITWYRADQGYVTSYTDGMRLVMFADAKTNTFGWNTSGWHVFGNADMRDCWASNYWYNYSGTYPSSGGVSVKTISEILIYSNEVPPATLFDGNVTLVVGETFNKTAYNSGTSYTINKTTPLGALQTAATSAGFGYEVTDKRWTNDQVLLLDNVSTYTKATGKWYAYVNGVYKDGYGNHANGLNVIELANNDQVNFYYAPNSDPNPVVNATAIVKIKANVQTPGPVVTTLFDGNVTLVVGETFNKTAYNSGTSYTINKTTPLGALQTAATSAGFGYEVTDKRWTYDQVLLLDNVSTYTKATGKWYAYVNGVYKDGYGNHANGLNVIELVNNDQVNFYYAPNSDPNPVANATAIVKIKANVQTPGPVVTTLFDGNVTLVVGETFNKTAYNSGTSYTINKTTPLGALQTAATSAGFGYEVTDKRWTYDQVLLLDNVSTYTKATGKWYAYVNGVYKDGYGNHANGLNVIELVNNDQVNFYYAPNSDPNPVANATAIVKIKANVQTPGPVVTTLFDGNVTLVVGETFNKTAYNSGTSYTINKTTPLGALQTAATSAGFGYEVTDKRWTYDQVLLLDNVSTYTKATGKWYAYVNGVYKDGYGNHANGLNVIELANNDQVNFYYAPNSDPNPVANATAIVKIKANIGGSEPVNDWTLSLSGAMNTSVTKTFFEQGLACPASGHQVFWTDTDNNTWGGVPLWVLVAMVDDNPDVGPDHFNFNDSIAAQGYSVKVTSGDGWDTTLSSQNIARNNSILVVNTLNGTPLPLLTPAGKRSWPLHLKGDAVFGGQQVGNITKIELTGLPQPPTEWKLTLEGDVTDTITQSLLY